MSSSHKFLLLLALPLAGCGFSPLYDTGGATTSVAQQLDTVEIQNIPERPGQILRDSLNTQFHAAGAPTTQLYSLSVAYNIATAGTGIQSDTSTTRVRFTATANWTLRPIGTPAFTLATPLATGQATTEDALNTIDQQIFSQDLETDTVDQELATEIAQQIDTQVAAYFKSHPTP